MTWRLLACRECGLTYLKDAARVFKYECHCGGKITPPGAPMPDHKPSLIERVKRFFLVKKIKRAFL